MASSSVGISATSVAGKDWTVQRSGGYEGMALQPGSGLLWGLLEKPLLGADGQPEGSFLRALAFDQQQKPSTLCQRRGPRYQLIQTGHGACGDGGDSGTNR